MIHVIDHDELESLFPQAVEGRVDNPAFMQETVGHHRGAALRVLVLTQESPEPPAQAKLGNDRGYGPELKWVHAEEMKRDK